MTAHSGSRRAVGGIEGASKSAECIFTRVTEVKKRRRGVATVSSKHQVTIPVDALRDAGIRVGERLVAHAEGPGRVVFEREEDILAEFAGALTGVYEPDELARLRGEWD